MSDFSRRIESHSLYLVLRVSGSALVLRDWWPVKAARNEGEAIATTPPKAVSLEKLQLVNRALYEGRRI